MASSSEVDSTRESVAPASQTFGSLQEYFRFLPRESSPTIDLIRRNGLNVEEIQVAKWWLRILQLRKEIEKYNPSSETDGRVPSLAALASRAAAKAAPDEINKILAPLRSEMLLLQGLVRNSFPLLNKGYFKRKLITWMVLNNRDEGILQITDDQRRLGEDLSQVMAAVVRDAEHGLDFAAEQAEALDDTWPGFLYGHIQRKFPSQNEIEAAEAWIEMRKIYAEIEEHKREIEILQQAITAGEPEPVDEDELRMAVVGLSGIGIPGRRGKIKSLERLIRYKQYLLRLEAKKIHKAIGSINKNDRTNRIVSWALLSENGLVTGLTADSHQANLATAVASLHADLENATASEEFFATWDGYIVTQARCAPEKQDVATKLLAIMQLYQRIMRLQEEQMELYEDYVWGGVLDDSGPSRDVEGYRGQLIIELVAKYKEVAKQIPRDAATKRALVAWIIMMNPIDFQFGSKLDKQEFAGKLDEIIAELDLSLNYAREKTLAAEKTEIDEALRLAQQELSDRKATLALHLQGLQGSREENGCKHIVAHDGSFPGVEYFCRMQVAGGPEAEFRDAGLRRAQLAMQRVGRKMESASLVATNELALKDQECGLLRSELISLRDEVEGDSAAEIESFESRIQSTEEEIRIAYAAAMRDLRRNKKEYEQQRLAWERLRFKYARWQLIYDLLFAIKPTLVGEPPRVTKRTIAILNAVKKKTEREEKVCRTKHLQITRELVQREWEESDDKVELQLLEAELAAVTDVKEKEELEDQIKNFKQRSILFNRLSFYSDVEYDRSVFEDKGDISLKVEQARLNMQIEYCMYVADLHSSVTSSKKFIHEIRGEIAQLRKRRKKVVAKIERKQQQSQSVAVVDDAVGEYLDILEGDGEAVESDVPAPSDVMQTLEDSRADFRNMALHLTENKMLWISHLNGWWKRMGGSVGHDELAKILVAGGGVVDVKYLDSIIQTGDDVSTIKNFASHRVETPDLKSLGLFLEYINAILVELRKSEHDGLRRELAPELERVLNEIVEGVGHFARELELLWSDEERRKAEELRQRREELASRDHIAAEVDGEEGEPEDEARGEAEGVDIVNRLEADAEYMHWLDDMRVLKLASEQTRERLRTDLGWQYSVGYQVAGVVYATKIGLYEKLTEYDNAYASLIASFAVHPVEISIKDVDGHPVSSTQEDKANALDASLTTFLAMLQEMAKDENNEWQPRLFANLKERMLETAALLDVLGVELNADSESADYEQRQEQKKKLQKKALQIVIAMRNFEEVPEAKNDSELVNLYTDLLGKLVSEEVKTTLLVTDEMLRWTINTLEAKCKGWEKIAESGWREATRERAKAKREAVLPSLADLRQVQGRLESELERSLGLGPEATVVVADEGGDEIEGLVVEVAGSEVAGEAGAIAAVEEKTVSQINADFVAEVVEIIGTPDNPDSGMRLPPASAVSEDEVGGVVVEAPPVVDVGEGVVGNSEPVTGHAGIARALAAAPDPLPESRRSSTSSQGRRKLIEYRDAHREEDESWLFTVIRNLWAQWKIWSNRAADKKARALHEHACDLPARHLVGVASDVWSRRRTEAQGGTCSASLVDALAVVRPEAVHVPGVAAGA